MSTPVLFLDGASRHRGPVDRSLAEQTAITLIKTLRRIKKLNGRFALNTEIPLGQYLISENWLLQLVLSGNDYREEWEFIKDLGNRSPLSEGIESLLPKVEASEFRTRPSGVQSIALAWATLLDSGIVSFRAHADWSRSWVETEYSVLEDDGSISDSKGAVRNANEPSHADEHAEWLRLLGCAEFPTVSQVWGERIQRFPGLRFLPRVEKDFSKLFGSGAPYSQALSSLGALSNDVANWPPGQDHPSFSIKVTPEHETRRKLCWWNDEATGTQELFDRHARFTGSFAGRIHFRVDALNRMLVVAYVGGKL